MTTTEAPIYGRRRGGGEEEKQGGAWSQHLHTWREVGWEMLTSKNTYRVLFLTAYSVLMLWVLTNVGHMAGNVGQLAEENSFWKHARRVAKKTVQFQAAITNTWSPCTNCTEAAPKLSIDMQSEEAGEEGEEEERLDMTPTSTTEAPFGGKHHEEDSQEASGGGEGGGGEGGELGGEIGGVVQL